MSLWKQFVAMNKPKYLHKTHDKFAYYDSGTIK
jgi:hypothetical protein